MKAGVTSIRVLLVGGGGGGANGDRGGGGGGYVACGNFTVNNGTIVSVTVGAGGLTSSSLPSTCPSLQVLLALFECIVN